MTAMDWVRVGAMSVVGFFGFGLAMIKADEHTDGDLPVVLAVPTFMSLIMFIVSAIGFIWTVGR